MLFKNIFIALIVFSSCQSVQLDKKNSIEKHISNSSLSVDPVVNEDIRNFEALLLCHCQEYFTQKVFKGQSESFLSENKGQLFGDYASFGSHVQFYAEKHKHSKLFERPYSVVWGTSYDFSRIDSLYLNPMYKHYINVFKNTAHYPDQIGSVNYIYDCYFRIKEMPLEEELAEFIRMNPGL